VMSLCPGLPRVGLGPPARADQPKMFTVTQSDWLLVAERHGLGLKGLVCTIDK